MTMESSMRQLLRFELYYFSRQPAFFLVLLMALGLGLLLSDRVVSSGEVQFYSPQNISYFLASYSIPSLFFTTILAACSLIRDKSMRFDGLIKTTKIPSSQLLTSRFLSLFIASLVLSIISISAYLLPTLLTQYKPEIFGRFSISNIIWSLVYILLPNLLFICGALFAVCRCINSSLWVYLTGVGIYVFYLSITVYLDSPMFTSSLALAEDGMSLVSMLDPFAVSAFLEQTKHWTTIEKNTQLIEFTGTFALNRIIWLSFSYAIILGAIFYSKRLTSKYAKKSQNFRATTNGTAQPISSDMDKNTDLYTHKAYSSYVMFKHTFLIEFNSVFRSLPFALLGMLTAILVIGQFISSIEMGGLIGPQHPYTSLLAPQIVLALKVVSIMSISFYSAELVYRSKEHHFFEVLNATPASRWALFIAQLLTLSLLILCLLAVAVFCAIAYQIGSGFYRIDWILYASLIPIYVFPMVYLAIMSMFIQLLLNDKYLGIMVSAIIMLFFTTSLSSYIGLDHVLLRFSTLGTIRYSDFNGFDYFLTNITYLSVHWAAVSGLLILGGYALFNRQVDTQRRTAIKHFFISSSTKQRMVLAGNVIFVLLSTALVFFNTNVLNKYETRENIVQLKVDYEQQFLAFSDANTPLITDIKANVQFFPQQYAIEVSGEFLLKNASDEAISEFLVTMPNRELVTKISVIDSKNIEHIARHNTFIVNLKSPLAPGATSKLTFSSNIERAGFKNTDHDLTLISNGSYFHSEAMFPYIGFNPALTITDEQKRVAISLPKHSGKSPLVDDKKYGEHLLHKDANLVSFEATVSTTIDQIAVAPGELVNEWQAGNRRYFQYKVSKPTTNFFGFSSVRYAILVGSEGDTKITLYYHPSHDLNVKQIMTSAKASLKVFSETFSPYPFRQLTIAEIPFRGFARAYPATIFYSENAGFKENLTREDNLDDLSSVVAHEVAHQWWGHQLKSAKTQGSGLLIESLAEYSSLMVMQEIYGDTYVKQELARASNRYLSRRAELSVNEPPLLLMGTERYLRYEKGLLALSAIANKVGQTTFHQLLSRFIKDYSYRNDDYVTNLDFLRLFETHPHRRYIENWLTKVMLYDAKISDVAVKSHENQQHELSFSVNMSASDHTRSEQPTRTPANEEVDFVIYDSGGALIYTGELTVINGVGRTSIYLPTAPRRIEIDPHFFYLDRQRTDNTEVISSITNNNMESL